MRTADAGFSATPQTFGVRRLAAAFPSIGKRRRDVLIAFPDIGKRFSRKAAKARRFFERLVSP